MKKMLLVAAFAMFYFFQDLRAISVDEVGGLLRANLPDNFYTKVFCGDRHNLVVDDVRSKYVTFYKLYECVPLYGGSEENSFIVAIKGSTIKILTDSVESLNEILAEQRIRCSTSDDFNELAMESIKLTRPRYKRFEVIYDSKVLTGLNFKESSLSKVVVDVPPRASVGVKDGDYFEYMLIRSGRDLIRRKVSFSQSKIEYDDAVLFEKIFEVSSPHDL
jgi:hypothetical protein